MQRKGYESTFGPAENIRQGTGSKTAENDPLDDNTKSIEYGVGLKIQPNQISACENVLDADCWMEKGEWALVESSNVAAIAYNANAKELYVEFLGKPLNSIYAYSNVPADVAKDFFNASSSGRYVWQKLRGKYGYKKSRAKAQ